MPAVAGVNTYVLPVGGTEVVMPGTATNEPSTIDEPVMVSPLAGVTVVVIVTEVPAAMVRVTPAPEPASMVNVGDTGTGADTVRLVPRHGSGVKLPLCALAFKR